MDSPAPTREDLLAVAAFADQFDAPNFCPGEWHTPEAHEGGVREMGWWEAQPAITMWEQALYEHRIIDPHSDYLGKDNVNLVNAAIKDPALVDGFDLSALRRALTFLARAERHSGGGWFEEAFGSGMAQRATRRLGELS